MFTSDRDGNPEVYFGDVRATAVRRLTTHTATDGEPALHPRGDRIAFVSMRSGTPRLWMMDTLGGSLAGARDRIGHVFSRARTHVEPAG